MSATNLSCVFVLLVLAVGYGVDSERLVVCYYGTWATYRYGLGKFDVENINPDLCTHLVYTFVGINDEGTVISLDSHLDLPDNWGRDNFGRFNALKQRNPNLKTLLAVGGWNEGSAKYSIMAASATYRKNFVDSALKMVTDYGFDGFDLDWEYPNRRDSVYGEADIDNFTQLIKELREAFDEYGLLLTAAVSAVEDAAAYSYDIPAISEHLDLINIMTYDLYGAWDAVTGHNAPLHRGEGDEGVAADSLYTVEQALAYWIGEGCPPEKIAVGIPFYGRSFMLSNANVNGVRAPASGPGVSGPYTATDGFVGYNEFCDMLQTESWTQRYDSLAKVPYAVKGNNWVSYDNVQSVIEKVEYIKSLGVAGVMIWSIETDDFLNVCGEGDFPLLRAINKALNDTAVTESPVTQSTTAAASTTLTVSSTTSSVTTSAPTTSDLTTSDPTTSAATTSAPTTSDPTTSSTTSCSPTCSSTAAAAPPVSTESDVICKQEGYAVNPLDCSSFYMCLETASGALNPVLFSCPATLYWDQKSLNCNYADMVECYT